MWSPVLRGARAGLFLWRCDEPTSRRTDETAKMGAAEEGDAGCGCWELTLH